MDGQGCQGSIDTLDTVIHLEYGLGILCDPQRLLVSWQENPVLVLFMEALGVVSSCTCETSHCIGYKMTCVCCGSSA